MYLNTIPAIIQNEFRVQWRRRGLLVLTLSMVTLPIAAAFFMRSELVNINSEWVVAGAIDPEQARRQLAQTILAVIWAPLYVVLSLILPILTADAVPRDRQADNSTGWGELLDSLPVPGGIYLLGKLLGVWASALASCLAAMLITGMSWWLLLGPFDLSLYLQEWLFGAAALAMLNGGLSTLAAATQPSARRGVGIGISISLITITWLMLSPLLTRHAHISIWDYLNFARPVLFLYFFQNIKALGAASQGTAVSMPDVYLTLVAGMLELALVGLVAWKWMSRSQQISKTIPPQKGETNA